MEVKQYTWLGPSVVSRLTFEEEIEQVFAECNEIHTVLGYRYLV